MDANPVATECFDNEPVHTVNHPVASSSGTVEQLSVFDQPTGPTKTQCDQFFELFFSDVLTP